MRRWPVLVCMLFALALVAVGCGKSEREEFADEGNAICSDLEERSQRAERRFESPKSAKDIEAGVAEITPAIQEGRRRFQELDPPSDLKDELAAYVRQLDEGARLLDEFQVAAAKAFESRDTGDIEEVGAKLGALDRKNDAVAGELGFGDCVEEEEGEQG